ncbi:cysteine proteinase [Rhizophagus clarus]|uniref:ubiquitinyl hydrolase 1 n=1 Tax=Rhizophagus clarus TaxID=94130 RepID=A0A8H3QEW5_9GLOM|nr:cysteine proteinase [Rhizophagus clarus]
MSNITHKSLAQLKKEASITYEPNHFNIKQWLAVTNKLLEAGGEYEPDESVYINNIKASIILLEIIPKHKDFENMNSRSSLEFNNLKNDFSNLKNKLPLIIEKAEKAAKALEKREESNRNINPSLQPGLPRSPVYIVSDNMNMIGNISSSDSSTFPMNPYIANLRNNGLNVDMPQFQPTILSMPIPIPTPPSSISDNNSTENKSSSFTTLSSTGSNLQQIDPLANYKFSNSITATELFKLLTKTDPPIPKILILDVRLRSDFDVGHIKTDNIVCLEPIVLPEGISTIDLEDKLILSPQQEQDLFKNRDKFDLVVYYDKDSTYNASSDKFSSPSEPNGCNEVLSRLKSAIYVNDYKKNLKRPPVLLFGGYTAWKRYAADKWIEKSNTNGDKSKRNGIVISNDNPTSWVENISSESKIQNNEPISAGRAPIVRTMFEYFQQTPEVQSMTNANYVDRTNVLHDYNNYQPKILSSSPPSLSQTISNDNSGSINKLQRRKTIFDNPYYSFSKVDNPNYASLNSPPPPKPSRRPPPIPAPNKPLPQVPDSNTNRTPSLSNNYPTPSLSSSDSGQMTMQQAPISDSSFSQLGSGIGSTGLKNLGNTCFMNSIIQCLSGTVPFARYFLDGSYKRHINRTNPLGTKGVLAEAFATLIKVLWSDSYTFVSPVTFKEAIGRFAPQFSGTEQQDSQEFLSFLLDGLHEDLNIIKEKPKIPELTPKEEEEREYLPSQMVSEMEWEKYLLRNSSVVVSLFQGQFRNILKCLTCEKTSTTYNVFMCLTLPIPHNYNGERIDLYNCLNTFVKEEILDGDDAWHCPRCKCLRRATKQLTISRLPDVLLIHLKRFSFNGPFRDKLETMVYFPIRGFDLTQYIPLPKEQPSTSYNSPYKQSGPFIYDLFAVSNHYGGLNGGHYTACVRNGYRHEWHNFDDSRVSACEEYNIMTQLIMVYKKNRKKVPMDIDDVSEEYNEEKENSDSEDEYVVEKIIDHRKIKGVTQYYLKWKGYPDDENTWENESDVFAKELIEKYWKRENEKSKKKPVESPEESSEEDSKRNSKENNKKIEQVKKKQTIITNNQVNIRKRKFSDSFNEEPDFSLLENFPPPSLTNWEEEVDDVETVEKNSKDSGLLIYLNWKNGHRTRHPASVANLMCPQKIIRFYEEHLKFKDFDED